MALKPGLSGSIDKHSEHKIDLMQEQLSALQHAVQQITRPSAPCPPSSSTPSPACQVSSRPAFEGQSSFNNETRLARDAAYSAVSGLQTGQPNDDVSAALASLKHSLDKHDPSPAQGAKEVAELSQVDEPFLPVNFVVAVVRKIKGLCIDFRRGNSVLTLASTTSVLPCQPLLA